MAGRFDWRGNSANSASALPGRVAATAYSGRHRAALRHLKVGKTFKVHQGVNHGAGQYAAGDQTTNTIESFFSIFERGMEGVHHHALRRSPASIWMIEWVAEP